MAEPEKETKEKTKKPTALKRDIQNIKRRANNRSFKSRVKTALKSLDQVLSQKDASQAQEKLSMLYKLIDKGVNSGIYKKNKSARMKSRIALKAGKAV